jgi:hypothetical protein
LEGNSPKEQTAQHAQPDTQKNCKPLKSTFSPTLYVLKQQRKNRMSNLRLDQTARKDLGGLVSLVALNQN